MEIERPKTPLEMIFALEKVIRKMSRAKGYIEFGNLVSKYNTLKHFVPAVLPLGTSEKIIYEFDNRAIEASNKHLSRMLK